MKSFAKLGVSVLCLAFAAGGTILLAQKKQEPAPTAQEQGLAIRTTTEEVLLDVVARDKKGRLVHDLKPEELRVFEDGEPQKILAFRRVEQTAILRTRPEGAKPAQEGGEEKPDLSRQINLVTLIFERLGTEGRYLARQGALDFLASELQKNVLVSVFALDQNLYILQQFTNDRKLLRQAIERATGGAYSQFPVQSEAIRQELQTATQALASAEGQAAAIGRGAPPGAGMASSFRDAVMAQMTLDILQFSDEMQRTEQGRSSIFGLLSLVKEQSRLSGRKTILYFSEGLNVPPNVVEYFRSTIGFANSANVSFYAVDARGLLTQSQNTVGLDAMMQAGRASAAQVLDGGRHSITREDVMSGETAEASLRMNVQEALATLSYSTGGFPIANTNDLRVGMREVAEDIRGYYEITYRPPAAVYDGRFRKITVQVLRAGVNVQSRSGYFALPPAAGVALLPYEAQMLATLSSEPLPRDFDYRAQALRFGRRADGVDHAVVIEAALKNFQFEEDKQNNLYRTRFSVLALVKDAQGHVVRKLSENYPLEGPLDKLPSLKLGDVVFSRELRLAPGRYTLETVVFDRETRKASARRTVLMVPPSRSGIAISSLSVIRRADPVEEAQRRPDDPFLYQNVRIIPNLGDTLKAGSPNLPIYFVVYPQPGMAEPPKAVLECLKDGQAIARADVELPKPDASGRIVYVGAFPSANLAPGQYELRAVVQQGGTAAEEHAFFGVM